MMRKVATFHFSAVKGLPLDSGNMIKIASSGTFASSENAKKIIRAEVEKHPSALFFRAKAIEADVPNNNGDSFSEGELKKSCETFIGVPFFTNHENQDVEKAKGKVVWAEWDDKDKAIYVVAFVDREAYPNLCRGIEQEYMSGVSMGCSVEYSRCSICGNKAATMDEYCSHIRNLKGRKFTGTAKDVSTGETKQFKNASVHEDNYGIRFIELSGVADPACPSCHIDTIYDGESLCGEKAAQVNNEESNTIMKAARCYNDLYMIKEAAIGKKASQQQIDSLNQCLQTIEQVSVGLIQNRANVEMEFASDLVGILAELQDFVDQLVQAGFGQLPDTSGQPVPGTVPDDGMGNMQQVAEEEDLGVGDSNLDEPLLEEPASPEINLDAFNDATRPSPSVSERKLQRPTRPERTRKAEEDGDMKRRLPRKSAENRERTKSVLSDDWTGQIEDFSNNLSRTLKNDPFVGQENGGQKMANDKHVEAKSSQSDLHVITEKQLEEANVGANPREGDDRDEITQGQLEDQRDGEREVITEAQLETKDGANPREEEDKEIITEKQLEGSRKDSTPDEITQGQLDPDRVGEQEVITEVQLSNPPTDTPWERSCSTSVSKHIEASASVLAKAAVVSGTTPEEAIKKACSMSGGTSSNRLKMANRIWNADPNSEKVSDIVAKAKFWNEKGVKVASSSSLEDAILAFASEAVHADGLNPEILIDSFHGIRDNEASHMVNEEIDKVIEASSSEEEVEDVRSEINNYFKNKDVDSAVGEAEEIVASLESGDVKTANHVIEASVEEVECQGLEGEELNKVAHAFAKGACAAHNLKMASLINVTVENDLVTIAVETENESVEIPLGDTGSDIEEEPIEDLGEEPLEEEPLLDETANMGGEPLNQAAEPMADVPAAGPTPAGQDDILGLANSSKDMTKEAQFGGGNAQVPGGTGSDGAGAGAAEGADLATGDMMPAGEGIQSFTGEEIGEEEELTGGEQQEPGTVCPICKSDDTETGKKDQQPGQFDCNSCKAKYIMHFNIDILNPEELLAGGDTEEALEMPEMPEMPVAAFVDMDKNIMSKFASDMQEGRAYCPGCGEDAEIEGNPTSHKVKCASCGTVARRDMLVDLDSPKGGTLRVEWNLLPKARKCAGCNDARKAFASDLALKKLLKSASNKEFPVENATAWIDSEYGKDAVVSYGPYKGQKLATAVVEQLKAFGLDKFKYMKRLCSTQMQEDPMEACLSLHKKQGFTYAESQRMCDCIKKKYANESDENIFMAAFAGMIDDNILRKMADYIGSQKVASEEGVVSEEEDMLISDIKIKSKSSEEKVSKKTASDKKLEKTVVEKEDNVPSGDGHIGKEKETIPAAKEPQVPRGDATMGNEEPCNCEEVKVPVDMQYLGEEEPIGDKEISKKQLGIVAASDESHMSDGGPGEEGKSIGKVEDIECCDDVPRGDAKMGHEEPPADKSPEVPRGDAKMGDEDARDFDEPTVPQGSDAERVDMRGRVAAESERQHKVLAEKRREKAVKLAASLVAKSAISDSEFEETVSDLVNLPLDRMEAYANRLLANTAKATQKTASTMTSPVVLEDRGLKVDEPQSIEDSLAGMFTVGNQKADKYFKDGSVDQD